MNRTEYKAAASAYRARESKAKAICLAFEHRPPNADHASEMADMKSRMDSLTPVPMPAGFSRAPAYDALVSRSKGRKVYLAQNRADAAEIVRRANELIELSRLGLLSCHSGWVIRTESIAKGMIERRSNMIRMIRGGEE